MRHIHAGLREAIGNKCRKTKLDIRLFREPDERSTVHELAIAENLLGILVEEARSHGIVRIKKVKLQIGELAAVVPESLAFCFELVSRDTIAEGSEIEIENVGLTAHCRKCDKSFAVEEQVFLCPGCGGADIELISGRELCVSSIEGETGEEDGANQSPCGS